MFGLLVPALPDQPKRLGGDKKAYDRDLRPALMVRAIRELQDAGVEPDVWKIEGLDRREDCVKVAEAARRDGRRDVGCIVLGRGEDERHVHGWPTTAAGVPGFVGLAVGRTNFWDPLVARRDQKTSRDAAVAETPGSTGSGWTPSRTPARREPVSGPDLTTGPGRELSMPIGMIGLGGMGADMTHCPLRGGPPCVDPHSRGVV